jgi:hypothetical protein
MFKKILFGTILFALIAILVVGAVIRTTDRTSTYGGGLGQGRGRGDEISASNSEAPRWGQQTQTQTLTTVAGTVASVNENALSVKLTDGSQVVIENRPWWFAQQNKFTAQVGDQVKVTGFWYNGTFEVSRIENVTTGKTVQVRDEYGRPGWSGGRGQRGG